MAGIIEFPRVVEEALEHFGDLLPNEPQRQHFGEYLTGLFVVGRKNVSAINREFAQAGEDVPQVDCGRFLGRRQVTAVRGGGHRLDGSRPGTHRRV